MMKSISHRIKNHESLRFLHVYFNLCDTTPLDSPHVLLCQRCHLMDRHSAPADDTSIWSVRTAVIRRLCVAARSLKYFVVINFLRDRQTNRHRQPKEEIALVSFRIQSAVHFQETKYHLLPQDLIQMSWNPRLRHCQDFFFFLSLMMDGQNWISAIFVSIQKMDGTLWQHHLRLATYVSVEYTERRLKVLVGDVNTLHHEGLSSLLSRHIPGRFFVFTVKGNCSKAKKS